MLTISPDSYRLMRQAGDTRKSATLQVAHTETGNPATVSAVHLCNCHVVVIGRLSPVKMGPVHTAALLLAALERSVSYVAACRKRVDVKPAVWLKMMRHILGQPDAARLRVTYVQIDQGTELNTRMSRLQAIIIQRHTGSVICDLDSINGTWVDDVRVPAAVNVDRVTLMKLRVGSRISFQHWRTQAARRALAMVPERSAPLTKHDTALELLVVPSVNCGHKRKAQAEPDEAQVCAAVMLQLRSMASK